MHEWWIHKHALTWGTVYSTTKVIDQNPCHTIFVAAVTKLVVKQYVRVVVSEALKGLFYNWLYNDITEN